MPALQASWRNWTAWPKLSQNDTSWPKLTQGDPSRVDPKRCKLTQVDLILTLSRSHSDLSTQYPDHIYIISRLHPDQTNLAKNNATVRLPQAQRPNIWRFIILPLYLFSLSSVPKKPCVLCGINCFAGAVLPPSQMVLFEYHLKINPKSNNSNVFSTDRPTHWPG